MSCCAVVQLLQYLQGTRVEEGILFTEGILFSKSLTGAPLRYFDGVSHKDCRVECLARKWCKSYNYWRQMLLCELQQHDIYSPGVELKHEHGVVFSQKCNWTTQMLHSDCNDCSFETVCDVSHGPEIKCTIMECLESPPDILHASNRGNLNHLGAKRRHFCDEGFNKFSDSDVSVCQSNGTWTTPTMVCVPQICSQMLSDLPQNTTVSAVNISLVDNSVYAYFECPTPLIARRSPLACNLANGFYNDRLSCCDTPDEDEWIKVYRLQTGTRIGSLMFWLSGKYAYSRSAETYTECQMRQDDILDYWQDHSISEVKVEIFENSAIKQWVIFNAKDSNLTSWFQQQSVLNSSWTDLNADTINYFKMYGKRIARTSNTSRLTRFLIADKISMNCNLDKGWLFVNQRTLCDEHHEKKPVIQYAPNNGPALASELHVAEKIEISVKMAGNG